jgi:hypothetical protein
MASRVSYLLPNSLPYPLLPAVEVVSLSSTQHLTWKVDLQMSSSLSHSTLHNSHYSLRAHCIGGDIRLYFVLPQIALVTLGAHMFG